MLIIPAVDLRRGYCVRLLRGDPKKETVYSEDPVRVALEWEKLGARYPVSYTHLDVYKRQISMSWRTCAG